MGFLFAPINLRKLGWRVLPGRSRQIALGAQKWWNRHRPRRMLETSFALKFATLNTVNIERRVATAALKRETEIEMRNKVKSPVTENMHALLECVFADYACELRVKYPTQKIRNAAVIASGEPEFARLGFIELVDARKGIPAHVPEDVTKGKASEASAGF